MTDPTIPPQRLGPPQRSSGDQPQPPATAPASTPIQGSGYTPADLLGAAPSAAPQPPAAPSLAVPRPGDYGVIQGRGMGAALIRGAQLADGMARGYEKTYSWHDLLEAVRYTHAFVVTAVDGPKVTAMEARPSGAGEATYLASDPRILWSTGHPLLTPEQSLGIVAWAEQKKGLGYSWEDYAYQAEEATGIPDKATKNRILASKDMLCSQFADAAAFANGVHYFDDGRWTGSVAPFELALRLLAVA
jgi:hypothetical protein